MQPGTVEIRLPAFPFSMVDGKSKINTSLSWFLGTSCSLKVFINNSATLSNHPCRCFDCDRKDQNVFLVLSGDKDNSFKRKLSAFPNLREVPFFLCLRFCQVLEGFEPQIFVACLTLRNISNMTFFSCWWKLLNAICSWTSVLWVEERKMEDEFVSIVHTND